MTMDRDTRKALIRRYLEADTTPAEEQRLREWFSTHPADADERDFARLIGLPTPGGLAETDDAAGAAAVALLLWLIPARSHDADSPLTPVQIAEGIQQMMLLDIGDIESITATPAGPMAILTAHLKDGTTCSYILSCNKDEGTTSLLACTNQ